MSILPANLLPPIQNIKDLIKILHKLKELLLMHETDCGSVLSVLLDELDLFPNSTTNAVSRAEKKFGSCQET